MDGIPKKGNSNVNKEKESKHSNVIDFTIKAAEIQVERFMDSLTAEQKLKLRMLETMFSIEKVAEMLQTKQFTVDDLFRLTAEKIFDN